MHHDNADDRCGTGGEVEWPATQCKQHGVSTAAVQNPRLLLCHLFLRRHGGRQALSASNGKIVLECVSGAPRLEICPYGRMRVHIVMEVDPSGRCTQLGGTVSEEVIIAVAACLRFHCGG